MEDEALTSEEGEGVTPWPSSSLLLSEFSSLRLSPDGRLNQERFRQTKPKASEVRELSGKESGTYSGTSSCL